MVYSISQLVSKKELVTTSNYLTSYDIKVRALGIAGDLASTTEPNDMTSWYCKAYKTLGEGKYAAIVSMAKQGRTPRSLFGYLLKEELKKCL